MARRRGTRVNNDKSHEGYLSSSLRKNIYTGNRSKTKNFYLKTAKTRQGVSHLYFLRSQNAKNKFGRRVKTTVAFNISSVKSSNEGKTYVNYDVPRPGGDFRLTKPSKISNLFNQDIRQGKKDALKHFVRKNKLDKFTLQHVSTGLTMKSSKTDKNLVKRKKFVASALGPRYKFDSPNFTEDGNHYEGSVVNYEKISLRKKVKQALKTEKNRVEYNKKKISKEAKAGKFKGRASKAIKAERLGRNIRTLKRIGKVGLIGVGKVGLIGVGIAGAAIGVKHLLSKQEKGKRISVGLKKSTKFRNRKVKVKR